MSDSKTVFPEGLAAFAPNEKQPDFVKASVIVTPRVLTDWLKGNAGLLKDYKGNKQLRLQLLESKKGTLYFAVDTFEPKPQENKEVVLDTSDDDGLPF